MSTIITLPDGQTIIIPDGMAEVTEPKLFKFERIGDRLEGVLLALGFERIKDDQTGSMKDVLTARLEQLNGVQVKFRPGRDLSQKIGKRHIGKRVLIFYREDLEVGRDSKMQVYGFFVQSPEDSQPPVVAPIPNDPQQFQATDDDLPPFITDEPVLGDRPAPMFDIHAGAYSR